MTNEEKKELFKKQQADDVRDTLSITNRQLEYLKIPAGAELFKLENIWNKIDIIPYIIKTNNHPSKRQKGTYDYFMQYHVHKQVGSAKRSVICPRQTFGKPCPICEEAERRKNLDDKSSYLWPQKRCSYNIIDRIENDGAIKIFEMAFNLFEKNVRESAAASDEKIIFADFDEGKTIKFRKSPVEKKTGTKTIKFDEIKDITFLDRKPYDISIAETAYSLDEFLVVLSYKEIEAIFLGIDNEDFDNEDFEQEKENEEMKKSIDRNKKSEQNKAECSHGHNFGKDADKHEECATCENWDKCVAVNDSSIN